MQRYFVGAKSYSTSGQMTPPSALRAGGLGVRDLRAAAEHLGVDESCAAFVAE
ncbi:MAG: hypothetical protein WDO06_08820 [Actinomycetota bacterium]